MSSTTETRTAITLGMADPDSSRPRRLGHS
jgi:hypothetical protein